MTPTTLLRLIDNYCNTAPRQDRDVVELPGALLFFHRESDHPFLSYARPVDPFPKAPAALLEAVREAFVERGRSCRWEAVLDLFPMLLPTLAEAGFPEPDRYPLMLLTREALRPAKLPGLEVRPVRREDDLRAVVQVPALAFEGKGEVLDNEVARFRASLGSGRRAFAAFEEGLPVSFGVHIPVGGLAEMAGVGTHPDHQRNGYAAAVCTALAEDAFAHGCNAVFLTAGTGQARRLYTRLGFRRIGTGLGATLSEPST